MKRKNYFMIGLILAGAVLFGIVAFVVIGANRTVQAVVPNVTIRAGERITNEMLATIQVPADTPKGFITDRSTLVGQKLKITAESGRFLYMSDVMVDWGDVLFGTDVPEDYIITALQIPNHRAVGGLITAGDTVDILGIPASNSSESGKEMMKYNLGAAAEHSFGAEGIQAYWILANVKILETDSSLSNQDDSLLSNIMDDAKGGGSQGAYYIVALSYEDYQKVLLADKYLDLWMNISPAWNNNNDPLLDVMTYSELRGLVDSQKQSVLKTEGEGENAVTKISEEWLEEKAKREKEWMEENGYQYQGQDPASSQPENPDSQPVEAPDGEPAEGEGQDAQSDSASASQPPEG